MTLSSDWAGRLASRGGEIGRAIANHDWAATPLGPIEGWSTTLKAIVKLIIGSPVPQALLVGPNGILIYNAGNAQICA